MNIMKTDKFILGLSLLALVACSESEVIDRPEPTPGADVKFGVSLDKTDTRTIYGDEAGNKFPIYWVQDDQVLVTSPDCMTGRQTGTYKISVKTESQNYANSMTKVGDAGVQWGDAATADFYSVYPADKATVLSEGKFNLTMPDAQRMIVEAPKSGNVLKCYPDMDACFMTAKKTDVANGSDVLLHYTPLSTAVRFTLTASSQVANSITVTQIKLKAYDASGTDMPITGDFTIDLTGNSPVVTEVANTSNEVVLYSYFENGAYLTMTPGQSVELNAFLIPLDNLEVNANWKLELTTSNNETYSISLTGSNANQDGNKLVAGKIHRIGNLAALKVNEEWDASKWMEYIPRNVYLSEISIPGSWNTLNKDHQSLTATDQTALLKEITDEYTAGVRAFHLDTRWSASREWVLSGLLSGHYEYTNKGLSLACGGDGNTYDAGSGNATKVMKDGVLLFKDALSTIVSQVKPKEYMMVFCTFAQNSYDFKDGTSWMEAVSQACDDMPDVLDGSNITENTVIADVLGKVIVIVNCASEVTNISRDDLPTTSSKCLFTYTPLVLDKLNYQGSKYKEGRIYKISNSQVTESGFGMVSSQAQIMAELNVSSGFESSDRGYGPTVSERKQKSQDILRLSKGNYEKGEVSHLLYYHGLGGYSMYKSWGIERSSDNQTDVAREFNNWIDGIVKNMSATPTGDQTIYYPVGVVLMNYVLSYKDVVKDILSLNNKYHKAYDPNRSPLGSDGGVTVQSAAPGYSAGMKDTGTKAIDWE